MRGRVKVCEELGLFELAIKRNQCSIEHFYAISYVRGGSVLLWRVADAILARYEYHAHRPDSGELLSILHGRARQVSCLQVQSCCRGPHRILNHGDGRRGLRSFQFLARCSHTFFLIDLRDLLFNRFPHAVDFGGVQVAHSTGYSARTGMTLMAPPAHP